MANKLATVFLLCCAWSATCRSTRPAACAVRARIDTGWLCGSRRLAYDGLEYATFKGVPYAKQPIGKRRFKELEPLEPWQGAYNAFTEGPVCPQYDVFYGRLMKPQGPASEACIHANIHVPLADLPASRLEYKSAFKKKLGLPILVFIHGGGFAFGSGDTDIHGPEYLVAKRVIVITFNYRIGPFGFLSLNSSSIPGNNGLRDQITLLKWVQRNARAFGGDPDDVTLGGQSAGAASAHLLSLSSAAEGLFKRVVLMSGTASFSFFSPSPKYAKDMANVFITNLGITSNDNEEIHRQLIEMPLENIMEVHKAMLEQSGLTVFVPVVESPHPGLIRVVENYPEILVAEGRGRDVPLLIGYTSKECESFRPRFKEIQLPALIKTNPLLVLPARLIYSLPIEVAMENAYKLHARCFKGTPTLDETVQCLSESYFIYPAIKLAEMRAEQGGAPVFLYEFSYNSEYSPVKDVLGLNYTGAAHVEDMTYVFRTNSIFEDDIGSTNLQLNYLRRRDGDDEVMKEWMTSLVVSFMQCSDPTCDGEPSWPTVSPLLVEYQEITNTCWRLAELSDEQKDMKEFYDIINKSVPL